MQSKFGPTVMLVALVLGVAGQSDAQTTKVSDAKVECSETPKPASLGKGIEEKSATAKSILCDDLARIANGRDNVPVSPAFTILNATPDTVIRPRTPNDFAASLLNNVDPKGNFQEGLALDFNPYMLWAGDRLTLRDYQENSVDRLLARTQLSIATTKGREDEDKSARLALGLHLSPWLESDPKLPNSKLLECMANQFVSALPETPPPKKSATEEEKKLHYSNLVETATNALDEAKDPTYKACRDEQRRLDENSSGWTIGLAPSWTSKNGKLDNLDWNGLSLWSSLAINLDLKEVPGLNTASAIRKSDSASIGQIIFHARYVEDEEVPNPTDSGMFLQQDSLILSSKLRINGPDSLGGGMAKDMKLSFAGAYLDASQDAGIDDTYYQWSASAELRLPQIAENLFLTLSAGTTSDRAVDNESFAGISLKWGFTDTDKK